MATLTGKKVKDTYKSLLKLEGDTGSPVAGASGNAVQVKTGDNDATALYLNTDRVGVGVADPDQALEVAGKVHISDEGSAPSAPSAGDGGVLYTKADGKPYWISDDVSEVALTNTVAVSADLDFGGYYSLDEQGRQDHVANTMPAPYYRFDGSDDKIKVTDSGLPGTGDNFSIHFRFLAPDVTTEQTLINKYVSSTDRYSIQLLSGKIISNIIDGGGSNNASGDIVADVVNTATLVWNTTTSTLYINGILQSGTTTAQHIMTDAGFFIGGDKDSPTYPSSTQFYDVRLFNKALTATEVKELYSGASVPFKYKGANQTEIFTGWDLTTGTDWALQGGGTLTDANTFGSVGAGGIATLVTASMLTEIGKRYKITFVSDNQACAVRSGSTVVVGTGDMTDFEFTASGTTLYLRLSSTGTVNITTLELTQIGAVAEYDGSGASATTWYDKSGNNLDGAVTGASLENKYTAIQVDNLKLNGNTITSEDTNGNITLTPNGTGDTILNGDVGIGTDSPAKDLDVAGEIRASTGLLFGTDTAAANTLDDYEEGTWTPAFTPTTGSYTTITYNAETGGFYTKIGNVVHFQGTCRLSAFTIGTGSGNLKITGFPFSADTGTPDGFVSCAYRGGFATNENPNAGEFSSGQDYITFFYNDAVAGVSQASQAGDLTATANVKFFGSIRVE
jgi:hypothetical protein